MATTGKKGKKPSAAEAQTEDAAYELTERDRVAMAKYEARLKNQSSAQVMCHSRNTAMLYGPTLSTRTICLYGRAAIIDYLMVAGRKRAVLV
jgi:hypothetical protein